MDFYEQQDNFKSIQDYNEQYVEAEFKEADKNHNGIISFKEEKDAHKNPLIGGLLKPIAGETLEQYKIRVLDLLNKYSEVTNSDRESFAKIREQLRRRIDNLIGTRYQPQQSLEKFVDDFIKDLNG